MPFTLPIDIAKRPILVLGAGTLGRRIALMFATQGAEVRLFDPTESARNEGVAYVNKQLPKVLQRRTDGTPGTIVPSDDLAKAIKDVWLVVEAVPENLELKKTIFGQLDELTPADCILASNSSSYASSQFIDRVKHPERVLNTHFMMPPTANAVELMTCGHTDPAIFDLLTRLLPGYGLRPFKAERESTGFIYNRIWAAIKREALAVAAEGVASPQVVDAIYTHTTGQANGPFRMMDYVGLDVVLDIEEHYAKERSGLPEGPRKLLKEMIAEGRLGRKSGKGFYEDYPAPGTGKVSG